MTFEQAFLTELMRGGVNTRDLARRIRTNGYSLGHFESEWRSVLTLMRCLRMMFGEDTESAAAWVELWVERTS